MFIIITNVIFFLWAVWRLFYELAHEKGAHEKMKNMVNKLRNSNMRARVSNLGRRARGSIFRRNSQIAEIVDNPIDINVDVGMSRVPSARRIMIGEQLKELNKTRWDMLKKETEALRARKRALENEMEQEIDSVEQRILGEIAVSESPPIRRGPKGKQPRRSKKIELEMADTVWRSRSTMESEHGGRKTSSLLEVLPGVSAHTTFKKKPKKRNSKKKIPTVPASPPPAATSADVGSASEDGDNSLTLSESRRRLSSRSNRLRRIRESHKRMGQRDLSASSGRGDAGEN